MINRTVSVVAAGLLLIAAHQPASAESCDADKQDLAYTFTNLGPTGETYDMIVQDVVALQKAQFNKQSTGQTSEAKIRLFLVLMQEEMAKRKADYIYMISDVVCSAYTKAELTDMVEFFDSDSGQSFMDKSSLIQNQVQKATQQFANEAWLESVEAASQRLDEEETYSGS